MFGTGSLFMKWNAYVPEGGNEKGRVATPISISIFDSYHMKSLWFKFGHDIFTGFKIPRLRGLQFHFIKWLKNRHSNFNNLPFWSQWRYHHQVSKRLIPLVVTRFTQGRLCVSQLTQASVLQKKSNVAKTFLISVMLRWHSGAKIMKFGHSKSIFYVKKCLNLSKLFFH